MRSFDATRKNMTSILLSISLISALVVLVSFPRTQDNVAWAGDVLFEKSWGGSQMDQLHAVQPLADGGFVVAGLIASNSFGGTGADAYDGYMARLTESGTVVWFHHFGGTKQDWIDDVIETSDGNFLGVGHTKSFGSGSSDFLVVKVDLAGNLLWQKAYGNKGFESAYTVLEENGGYLIGGWAHGEFGVDAAIFKVNQDGELLNPVRYYGRNNGGSFPDYAEDLHKIVKTSDGGYIISGWIHDAYDGQSINYDLWAMKLKSDFSVAWSREYGGSMNEGSGFDNFETIGIDATSDGGYILAGSTKSFSTSQRILLVKLASDGSIQWSKTVAGKAQSTANDVKAFSGYFLVTGKMGGPLVLLKISNAGVKQWFMGYDGGIGRQIAANYIIAGQKDNPRDFYLINDVDGSLGVPYLGSSFASVALPNHSVSIPLRNAYSGLDETSGGMFK